MKVTKVTPVVLCGGSGSRLWPLSRAGFPKQFLALTGKETLFQQACSRFGGFESDRFNIQRPLILTNEQHRFLAVDQLRELAIDNASFLLEPEAKNTAPALTLAALEALAEDQDPVLVVLPADQAITDAKAFDAAIQKAVCEAAAGNIVTLGISPTKPETGYGYLHFDQRSSPNGAHRLKAFVEKPELALAEQYVASAEYAWNAGIFILKASVWLGALRRLQPGMLMATTAAWEKRTKDHQFVRPDAELFSKIEDDSIDYAVMERAESIGLDVLMVPLAAGWSDLGAWDAVWAVSDKDESGNSSTGDVVLHEASDCHVHANTRMVAVSGLENIAVIETADAILVADKNNAQSVKSVVQTLEANQREEHLLHRKVNRPWGWYDSIDAGERFKVKRICVKSGASLSLQKHNHRAEHWIVVRGEAEVTCGEKTFRLTENQSTYIPIGEIHRLKNPGTVPLEMIEVQSGSYLGEDDIVRLEDDYGRS